MYLKTCFHIICLFVKDDQSATLDTMTETTNNGILGDVNIVKDVSLFKGHIACNPHSKSEIVVPIFNKRKKIVYVLDIDHDKINAFNEEDEENLRLINKLILEII